MMNFKNEEAVSPVIGVILMVAITVILAAVIAAFVFGMTGNVQTTKTVAMQSKLDGNSIVLTVNGGPDMPTLQQITISHKDAKVDFSAITPGLPASGDLVLSGSANDGIVKGNFSVGDVISFAPAGGTSGRLLIVGKWSDGAEQIILDRNF